MFEHTKENAAQLVIIASSDADALKAAEPTTTVEAEYGDTVVKGSILTLAHHGSRSDNPAPCVTPIDEMKGGSRIGISHVDLDTLGGIAKVIGHKVNDHIDEFSSFWILAAFVDVNGPHRLVDFGASDEDLDRLYAYWAFSQAHRVMIPRDKAVHDVTSEVFDHLAALETILTAEYPDEYEKLIDAGRAFRKHEEVLNRDSLKEVVAATFGDIAVRSSDNFTNHLYTTIDNKVCEAVLAFNEKFKSITLSFSGDQGNACEVMQRAFGPDAGGHAGIAGTPRGKEFTFDDTSKVLTAL